MGDIRQVVSNNVRKLHKWPREGRGHDYWRKMAFDHTEQSVLLPEWEGSDWQVDVLNEVIGELVGFTSQLEGTEWFMKNEYEIVLPWFHTVHPWEIVTAIGKWPDLIVTKDHVSGWLYDHLKGKIWKNMDETDGWSECRGMMLGDFALQELRRKKVRGIPEIPEFRSLAYDLSKIDAMDVSGLAIYCGAMLWLDRHWRGSPAFAHGFLERDEVVY